MSRLGCETDSFHRAADGSRFRSCHEQPTKGAAAKAFDLFLKGLIGVVVICFFGVVVYLGTQGQLDWGKIFSGFVPDPRQWTQPTGEVAALLATLPDSMSDFWSARVVKEQRAVMIGAAATAVGINMTFLMPYSMLNRGWDKPFRGLARFDLCTGMADSLHHCDELCRHCSCDHFSRQSRRAIPQR